MAEATLRLTPLDGRLGKSRQVPSVVIAPEDRLESIERQVERAFYKYHRRGIDAVYSGVDTSTAESKIIVVVFCAATVQRIGTIHITKEEA